MKNKTWLILLTFTVVLLLAYSGTATSGYFSDVENSVDNVLRIKMPFLKSADNFVVLAGSGIANTGTTTITGDIGSYPTYTVPADSIIFPLYGTNHGKDDVTKGAKDDLVIAYDETAARTTTNTTATELGGTTKVPGVYDSAAGTFGITGNLTLDGDANATWTFKMATTLITADNSQVSLINGAKAANVYWQVGSSATLGAGSTFKGNILALTAATLNTGANVEGRVLARNGVVTLAANTITKPAP